MYIARKYENEDGDTVLAVRTVSETAKVFAKPARRGTSPRQVQKLKTIAEAVGDWGGPVELDGAEYSAPDPENVDALLPEQTNAGRVFRALILSYEAPGNYPAKATAVAQAEAELGAGAPPADLMTAALAILDEPDAPSDPV